MNKDTDKTLSHAFSLGFMGMVMGFGLMLFSSAQAGGLF